MEELGLDLDALVADFGPHLPVPVLVADEDGVPSEGEPVPFVREEQQKRLRSRPSAPWPSSARSTRWRWRSSRRSRSGTSSSTEQLEDLRRTRKDLLDIVKEVDERVEQVFTEAWEDVRDGVRPRLHAAVPRR